MKFAVIYDSETGNTQKIAFEIYDAIGYWDKELLNLNEDDEIPDADVYFVGFPIHRRNCSLKIVECLEKIETGKVILFATCGLSASNTYREKLEDKFSVWISDGAEYLGLYLCQGETTVEQQKRFLEAHPDISAELSEMLVKGIAHPNEDDLVRTVEFTEQILRGIGA